VSAMATATKAQSPRAPAPSGELSPQLSELGLAFRHVFRTLSRLRGRDTHLQGSELSHAQFELLIELDERGDLSAGELAAAARLTPATVTQMLDHLAACGHV
jgi:DNA-binding MarR family transcriptional regulator